MKKIGIVGGGQLGKMITQEAKKMGMSVYVIDPTEKSPAGQIADYQIVADYKDEKAIKKLGSMVDVLTFEIELANSKVLEDLQKKGVSVHPSPKTLDIIKDKLKQKQFLRKAGIPVADFVQVESEKDILNVVKKFKYPVLLKARFDAYDGRGNAVIYNQRDIKKGLTKLKGRKLYIEKFVPFKKELAVMVVRSTKGEIAVYPVVETIHRDNICHIVKVPAPVPSEVSKKAQRLAQKTMKYLRGAGVFGIEMFYSQKGEVFINEIAPRVHNSGHYSIEASITSQFEQHLRAITGLPLGSTKLKVPASVMINILGNRQGEAKVNGLEKALKIEGVSVHIYGKKETRPERKMGHITVIDETIDKAYKKAIAARRYISI
ncbi:5-(carboxyamino)imidazole ribonucleotide synthase [Candidatus Gottesmanbacteria bacterium]|nr:5-(carboxyamino)imidazole ribonucleotide synthase [Candidatus Gottesmanbacteria bacterium]